MVNFRPVGYVLDKVTSGVLLTILLRGRAGHVLGAGAAIQFVLLAALSVGAGLGPVGWVVGTAYIACLCTSVSAATRRIPGLGPADLVTLGRAVLVGGLSAIVGDWLWTGVVPVAALVAIAMVALLLDAAHGQVARRTGAASGLGAQFDMEVVAFLVLVLSVYAAALLGPWALGIGTMRYAFGAAGRLLPWLRSAPPTRSSTRAVTTLQGIVLTLAASDVVARPLMITLVAAALCLLTWSFGRDVVWLWRNAHRGEEMGEPPVGAPKGGLVTGSHPVAARVVTALACVLVFVALVAPNQVAALTPVAFVRIPVEAVLGVAVLLVLSARTGRLLATLVGVVLGVLAILTLLDLGFSAVLARPFDPVLDWGQMAPLVDLLTDSLTRTGAIAAVVAAALLAVALVVLVTLSVRRLSGILVRRRPVATRAVSVLIPLWLVCAVLGVQIMPGVPVATANASALAYDRALNVRAGLLDHEKFVAESALDAFRNTPTQDLLAGLRGKDVVLTFVESYGRVAVEDPEFAPHIGAALDDGSRRLSAAGFHARSAFLTSSTAGGNSWLAHATFLSGLWIDNQQRHDTLVASDRMTLTSASRRANWRTVAVMPGSTHDWPEGGFYGYDQVYDVRNLGYHGPNLGWASTPDQYTLAAFQRAERAAPDHAPLLAEIALVSSHAPWPLIPDVIDWTDIGDGSIFNTMTTGEPRDAVWAKGTTAVRSAYRSSIEYSLNSLISYVLTYGDDNLVLVFLGDHQPAPIIAGEGADRDVPITIVARDPAVLDRISGWGWSDGLNPEPQAPVWRMDAFRDRFLTAFGPSPEPVVAAPGTKPRK